MCKLTPFGLWVKTELLRSGRTQTWLEGEIRSRYGFFVDNGYLYKIFTGQRRPQKIVQAIREILELPEAEGDEGERR